jgi:26S proteasome regulatory subunit N1
MLSAVASLGWLYLWDVEDSFNNIDSYLYSDDINIKAGALLATGVISSTVRNENEPALAILSEHVVDESHPDLVRAAAIMGLGIAYTSSNRDDVRDLLLPIVSDLKNYMQLCGLAAVALGQIYLGQGASEENEIASTMIQTLMEMKPEQLKAPWTKFYVLGLSLLFFGKQDASDAIIETLKAIDHPVADDAIVMLTLCSFAGTGDVLRIQQLLRLCAEKPKEKDEETPKSDEEKKEDEKIAAKGQFQQGLAVIAIAAIAMGEDVGKELCLRHFGHLVPPLLRAD